MIYVKFKHISFAIKLSIELPPFADMIGVCRLTTINTTLANLFRFTCVLTTLAMVLFWIYKYNLNLDLCRVDFRYYHQSKQDVFPHVSLCFMNPFLHDRLINYDTNISSYISYLEGKSINTGLEGVPYSNVTIDLEHYITEVYIQYTNGTYHYRKRNEGEKLLVNSYNGFWFDGLYKCFAVNVPQEKHIQGLGVKFRNNDFENGNGLLNYLTIYTLTLNIIMKIV